MFEGRLKWWINFIWTNLVGMAQKKVKIPSLSTPNFITSPLWLFLKKGRCIIKMGNRCIELRALLFFNVLFVRCLNICNEGNGGIHIWNYYFLFKEDTGWLKVYITKLFSVIQEQFKLLCHIWFSECWISVYFYASSIYIYFFKNAFK